MSAANFTYFMDIELPSVGTGNDYVTLINIAYQIIDNHDHDTFLFGGKQLSQLSVNWTSINLSELDIFNVYSLEFTPRLPPPGLTKIIFFKQDSTGIDLWYTDGNSNAVRITRNQNVNAVAVVAGFYGDFAPFQASVVYAAATSLYTFNILGGFANIHANTISPVTSMTGLSFIFTLQSTLNIPTPGFYGAASTLFCTQGTNPVEYFAQNKNIALGANNSPNPRLIQSSSQLMNLDIVAGNFCRQNRFNFDTVSNMTLSNVSIRTIPCRLKTYNTVYAAGGTTYQGVRNLQNGGPDAVGSANTPLEYTTGGIIACIPAANGLVLSVTAQAFMNASVPYSNPLLGASNKLIHMSLVFVSQSFDPVISNVSEFHHFDPETTAGPNNMQYTFHCTFKLNDARTGNPIAPNANDFYCVLRI